MESVLARIGHAPGPAELLIILVIVFFLFLTAAVEVVAFCMIFRKTGYHWALGFLMIIPLAKLIVPLILGFADWPIAKELRALKQQQAAT